MHPVAHPIHVGQEVRGLAGKVRGEVRPKRRGAILAEIRVVKTMVMNVHVLIRGRCVRWCSQ